MHNIDELMPETMKSSKKNILVLSITNKKSYILDYLCDTDMWWQQQIITHTLNSW